MNISNLDKDETFNPKVTEIMSACRLNGTDVTNLQSKNLNPWNTSIKFCTCVDEDAVFVNAENGFCEMRFNGTATVSSDGATITQEDKKRVEFSFLDRDGLCCNKKHADSAKNNFQCVKAGMGCHNGTYLPNDTSYDSTINPRVSCIDPATQQGTLEEARKTCPCRDHQREMQQAQILHASSMLAMASSADQRPTDCQTGLYLELQHRQRIGSENGSFMVNNGLFFRCVMASDLITPVAAPVATKDIKVMLNSQRFKPKNNIRKSKSKKQESSSVEEIESDSNESDEEESDDEESEVQEKKSRRKH